MEVNFNNLRLLAIEDFSEIIEILNNSLQENDGQIVLSPGEIEAPLTALSSKLTTIGCCFSEKDATISDLSAQFEIP